jgi:cyclic-di-GMP phosphodiesterase TipF (flagellum assembly factor)
MLRGGAESLVKAGAQTLVQGLVYIFTALATIGVGATAYFGFTFSPIESVVTAAVFGAIAVVAQERALRRRAENRLEKAIEELSRLLSTDAQAGAVLSQRINALTDDQAGKRLDGVEADISVLGTVIRQVAEAVAELEDRRKPIPQAPEPVLDDDMMAISPLEHAPEPVIPLEALNQAIAENRLVFHVEPIVILPLRRPHGYDLVPRLSFGDSAFADPPDFMPRRGGETTLRRIERIAVDEALGIAGRAAASGRPLTLYLSLSRATLADGPAVDQIVASLDGDRNLSQGLIFAIAEADWRALESIEKSAIESIVKRGAGLSLLGSTTLRLDFAELSAAGMRSVRVDATRFTEDPESFTDFHTSDIASYTRRFGVEIIATGVRGEQQIISLLEDGLTLVQGPHIAGPGPVRADLMVERVPAETALRRAEG